MVQSVDNAAQFGARLHEIANALGVPVEVFYNENASEVAGDFLRLIRLFSEITDSQGRNRILSAAELEAARCQEERGGPRTTLRE